MDRAKLNFVMDGGLWQCASPQLTLCGDVVEKLLGISFCTDDDWRLGIEVRDYEYDGSQPIDLTYGETIARVKYGAGHTSMLMKKASRWIIRRDKPPRLWVKTSLRKPAVKDESW